MSDWRAIKNLRTGEIILRKAERRAGFAGRLRGLIGVKRLPPETGLLCVAPRQSRIACAIHTMGMRFALAVVWLDENRVVVDACRALPWRMMRLPKAPARYTIEAEPDLLRKTAIGDQLMFNKEHA